MAAACRAIGPSARRHQDVADALAPRWPEARVVTDAADGRRLVAFAGALLDPCSPGNASGGTLPGRAAPFLDLRHAADGEVEDRLGAMADAARAIAGMAPFGADGAERDRWIARAVRWERERDGCACGECARTKGWTP